MTNADNLRHRAKEATDEELVEFIYQILKGAFVILGFVPTEEIAESVKQDWLEWLRQEAET